MFEQTFENIDDVLWKGAGCTTELDYTEQQAFLNFVLDQYIKESVGELDRDKIPPLLELKYQAIKNAVTELGSLGEISQMFVGFQQHLYAQTEDNSSEKAVS